MTAYSRLMEPVRLTRSQSEWHGNGIDILSEVKRQEIAITVHAPGMAVRYIHLRWNAPVKSDLHILGDDWERSYGNLGWRNMIPERVMPWYFATYDGRACHAYGVKTGASALCFWQLDPDGVSLWLNLSNGGGGVELGQRTLAAATVVTRKGIVDEEVMSGLHDFCQTMCSRPSRPSQPIYGSNDWYYAYGINTAKRILEDTDFVAKLCASNAVRPFYVIDDGWKAGPPAYPSMSELASQIRDRDVRPGIWIRPLEAPSNTKQVLLLPSARYGGLQDRAKQLAYDPTVPEARELALAKAKEVVEWGYELVKHDFTTYELLGRWGNEMGARPTLPGWSFYDRSRTNAEIILDLYQTIRQVCGKETLILGCNTIGHLGQGYFDIQRAGNDTSGRFWEKTRCMGVNTMAFRLPQHRAFFVLDPDCVGITAAIPWEVSRQWLDLIAQSGTALFVSLGEGSRDLEHAHEIQRAFYLASRGGAGARPLTHFEESTPQLWTTETTDAPRRELRYDWCLEQGAFPFTDSWAFAD
ncbi:MAG: hypothetical protein ABSD59_14960 [Terracidiphilus sp.]